MNQGRYFMPNVGRGINPDFVMSQPFMMNNGFVAQNNIFSKMITGIKNFNWNGLLNGAGKTLNVVNQTIPLIRQTRPMIKNVRNILNVVKAFKKETAGTNNNTIRNEKQNIVIKKEVIDGSYPNFFI